MFVIIVATYSPARKAFLLAATPVAVNDPPIG
jgi:hypothetical protein